VSDEVRESIRDERIALPNEELTTADIARSGQVSKTPSLARDERASVPMHSEPLVQMLPQVVPPQQQFAPWKITTSRCSRHRNRNN
jgi:hypothetical protein